MYIEVYRQTRRRDFSPGTHERRGVTSLINGELLEAETVKTWPRQEGGQRGRKPATHRKVQTADRPPGPKSRPDSRRSATARARTRAIGRRSPQAGPWGADAGGDRAAGRGRRPRGASETRGLEPAGRPGKCPRSFVRDAHTRRGHLRARQPGTLGEGLAPSPDHTAWISLSDTHFFLSSKINELGKCTL